MHPLHIHAPGVREKHQVIMRARREEMFDEIVLLALGAQPSRVVMPMTPLPAAPLRAIGTDVGALDQARCA